MPESSNSQSLTPGSMIQEYKIEKILGAGSFGIVYLASNIYLDEVVAIKEFLPSELASRSSDSNVSPLSSDLEESYEWALDRFLKEAEILWKLGKPHPHPNIVEVRRFHKDHGTAYMVMPYEEGKSLSEIIKSEEILSQEYLKSILLQLLDGLERVHSFSVLHRDIKPSNIMIRPDGSPVLIDFGAARRDFVNHAQSTLAIYSPMYAALEQIAETGKQGPWTDIYGLGATFYHLVTGKAPTAPVPRISGATHSPAVDFVNKNYELSFLTAIDAAIEPHIKNRLQSIAKFRKVLNTPKFINPSDKTIINKPKPLNKKKYSLSLLVKILIPAIVVMFALIVLLWVNFWKAPLSKVQPLPEQQSKPYINKTNLLAKIQKIIVKVECSSLTIKLSDDYNLLVFGHVGSKLDLNTLSNNLKSIEGLKQVETNVAVYEHPLCLAVNLLKQHGQESIETKDGIGITFNTAERKYNVGDFLVINARASILYDGYFYIDYLDSSDHVVTHLFPSPVKLNNSVKTNDQVIIGINREISSFETKRSYKLLHPGNILVMTIYSKNILFEKNRPEEEPIKEYLSDLKKVLNKVSDSESILFKLDQLTIK